MSTSSGAGVPPCGGVGGMAVAVSSPLGKLPMRRIVLLSVASAMKEVVYRVHNQVR